MSDDYIRIEVQVSRQLARDIVSNEHTAEDMALMFGREVVERVAEEIEDEREG